MENNNVKVLIAKYMDADTLWSEVFGGGWEYMDWWWKLEYIDEADWDKHGTAVMTYENPDDGDEAKTFTLTIDDLVRGYEIVLEKKYHHCGMTMDINDTDACVSDAILQCAIFGELVYG